MINSAALSLNALLFLLSQPEHSGISLILKESGLKKALHKALGRMVLCNLRRTFVRPYNDKYTDYQKSDRYLPFATASVKRGLSKPI